MINELKQNGIFEDVTEVKLKKVVADIIAIAVQKGIYEFVPGYYIFDNAYLIEKQKKAPDNPLLKNKDFTKAPFWLVQTAAVMPCHDGMNIAEIILMTEGLGIERGEHETIYGTG